MIDKIKLVFVFFFVFLLAAILIYITVINKVLVSKDMLILIDKNVSENTFLSYLNKKNIKLNKLEWELGKLFLEKKFVLKYGEYNLKKNTSFKDFLLQINNSEIYYRKFTLIEGSSSKDLKINLSKAIGLIGEIPKLHEGIYKPDTYLYKWGDTKESLLNQMKNNQKKILDIHWKKRKINFVINSKKDILILASIIEKEGKKITEFKDIASVFLNRLNKNMRLQADSTLAYGLKKKGSKLNKFDLKSNNIFNTYKYKGLPPTPISYPSENSIIAAANPNENDYLYFVSDGKGGHRFSTNYLMHKKNIRLWLKQIGK